MARRKTHEEFVAEVKALVGDEYKVISEYLGASKSITIYHSDCGNTFQRQAGSFLHNPKCAKCSRKTRGSLKRNNFIADVERLTGDEYLVMSEYSLETEKVTFQHSVCGKQFEMLPYLFTKRGSRCPHCRKTPRKTPEQFRKEFKEALGTDYLLLSDYAGSEVHVKVKHLTCGHRYDVTPKGILNGRKCPNCAQIKKTERLAHYSKSRKRTTTGFKKELQETRKREFSLVGKYTGIHDVHKFKHAECGGEFNSTPSIMLQGKKCPLCQKTQSKGEIAIKRFLDMYGIGYREQYRFEDCVYTLPLPFDFEIVTIDGHILIEFDGQQHFKPIDAWGGESALRETQHRDRIKDKYCADNGIPLIRIPYWEYDNIDAILTEKLLPLLKDNNAKLTQKQAVGI